MKANSKQNSRALCRISAWTAALLISKPPSVLQKAALHCSQPEMAEEPQGKVSRRPKAEATLPKGEAPQLVRHGGLYVLSNSTETPGRVGVATTKHTP